MTNLSCIEVWQPPPNNLHLNKDKIHVWHVSLRNQFAEISSFWNLLADDEKARANRFYFEKDRLRFILARSFLRIILSQYLQREPESLVFMYGKQGKPCLESSINHLQIEFNLSHSHDQALYAISHNNAVGVDIEKIEATKDYLGIAQRFFSPREADLLGTLSDEEQLVAFYRAWTRKEAIMKLLGEGFTIPLNQIEVTLLANETAKCLNHQVSSFADREINLWDILSIPGYASALATASPDISITFFQKQF